MAIAQLSSNSKQTLAHLNLSESQFRSLPPSWDCSHDYRKRECKALHGGMSGKVFLLDDPSHPCVMRLIPLAKGTLEVEKEIFYAQTMAQADISPKVFYANAKEGLVFMDYVPAQALGQQGSYPLSFFSELAALLKKLHAQKPSIAYTSDMLARTKSAVASLTLPLPSILGPFLQALETNATLLRKHAVQAVVHQDLNPNNVLFDGQRLWLIDWELTGQGDPCYDLATVLIFFALSEKEQQYFLAEYFGTEPSLTQKAKIHLAQISALAFYGLILQKIADYSEFSHFERLAPFLPKISASFQSGKRWADFDSPATISSFGMMMLKGAFDLLEAAEYRDSVDILRTLTSHAHTPATQ